MALRSVFVRATPSFFKNCFRDAVGIEGKSYVLSYFVQNPKLFHNSRPLLKKQEVSVVIERDGRDTVLKGKEGDSVLDVVVNNKLDLGGYGACEGTLSCSTCHVILSEEEHSRIPEKASDEELDMLDLAPDVCATSRLGCQIYLSSKIEGLRVKVPSVIKDQRDLSAEPTKLKS